MQNGAIWQRVASAAVNQRFEGLRHVLHVLDTSVQFINVRLRQAFDVSALPRLVIPKISVSRLIFSN